MLEGRVFKWNSGKTFESAMHRLSKIAFVGLVAWMMAGCESNSEKSSIPTSSNQPVVKPAAKPFDTPPMVSQVSPAPGLIKSTNPNERAKQVQKGRVDPFAPLFVATVSSAPTETTTEAKPQKNVPRLPNLPGVKLGQTIEAKPQKNVPRLPNLPGVKPGQTIAVKPLPGRVTSKTSPPGAIAGSSNTSPPEEIARRSANPDIDNSGNQPSPLTPPPIPSSTVQPVIPPPQQEPDLAKNVAVKGVIQVGSEYQAIIQVPNEATSRYVRVGQRISNGQVLIKRIEMNEGSEPLVVLEQYGVEVAKTVGEEPANSGGATTPTATNQAPPPPDSTPASGS